MVVISLDILTSTFGQCPSTTACAIQGDVQRRVLERIGGAATPGGGIPGRKHAAEHRDDREAVTSAVAQGIDIPPRVTIRGQVRGEVRAGLTGPGGVSIFHDELV